MIKAVIFDIDNTLYDYDAVHEVGMEALWTYCRDTFAIEKPAFMEVYRKAWSLSESRIGTDTAAIHSRMLRLQCMAELLGQPLFPHVSNMYHAYWDTLIAHMQPAPGILELLAELKKQGIKIGICTDMTAYIQYRKLEQLRMGSFIDMIVTSEEAGAEKPHPRIFELCVDKVGCRPEECVLIGDNVKKDVLGAVNYGLCGIWYSQEREPKMETEFPVIVSFEKCICKNEIYLAPNAVIRRSNHTPGYK